ncbi:type VII secretion protein EccE [Amycolatopsis sp.]|uniref:type VII secretion protein EccE n=1 Tax=Amycolatopsis sp. TaxID=37632 RepID=UPI0039C898C0
MSVDARIGTQETTTTGPQRASAWAWILPVRPLQLAIWELAGIAVLLAIGLDHVAQPLWITICALAAVAFLTTSIRISGRHLAGWALIWIGHRLRQHDNRRDSSDPLHRIVGPVRVRQHVDRAGNRFGVAEVDGGWTAIVRLTGPVTPEPDALMAILRETYRQTDIPLATAQLLTWTVPREDGEPFRAHWFAVRYRPDEAPIAALARGGGEIGALRSTACAALGLMGTLAEAGYESTVLEAGELGEELRVSLGVERQGTPEITDSWRTWSAGATSQACFAPRSRQDIGRALDLSLPTAAFTACSYTLRRTPAGKERSEVTLRVGSRQGDLPSAADLGLRVVPLHGRHAAAIRRTLPLALDV